MSLRDDINIPLIVVLGITTGLIVAVAIIGTRAGYNYVTQVDLARNYAEAEELGRLHVGKQLTDKQFESLKSGTAADPRPAWVDENKTVVRIPLDDAIRVMVETKGHPPTQ